MYGGDVEARRTRAELEEFNRIEWKVSKSKIHTRTPSLLVNDKIFPSSSAQQLKLELGCSRISRFLLQILRHKFRQVRDNYAYFDSVERMVMVSQFTLLVNVTMMMMTFNNNTTSTISHQIVHHYYYYSLFYIVQIGQHIVCHVFFP